MPKVSVIMPVYNGAKHIREAIDSVLAQTFQDWDFWIINEFGSNDGSAEIVSEYAQTDERFHLVQNQARLGLAESLNTGFRLAQGTYFARLDADDTAHPERFARQVALMENHPEVGICGTWQHHFGPNEDWVHCPPASADKCRARLLFNCDLCHSTLMLRREVVLEHQLFYDNSFGAEDYELWCRAVWVTDIVNIPEVLGEYRVGDGNITADKEAMLDIESGQLVARNLEQSLDIHLTEDEAMLFRGWSNPFDRFSSEEREAKLTELERILRQIYKHNTRRHAFDDTCLLEVLATKWRWAKYHAPWDAQYEVKELNQIFDNNYQPSFILRYKEFCAHNTTLGSKIKKIITVCLRPLARPFRTRIEGLLDRLEKNVCDYIEDKTWDRYLRLSAELRQTSAELQARQAARLEMRMQDMAQVLIQSMDSRIWQAEQALTQSTESQIRQAEQALTQSTDSRIWQAEQALTQSTDSRIWQAEQALTQSTDSRIWRAELELKNGIREILEYQTLFASADKVGGKRIFLIGTPEHSNIGDAAIALGEAEFIHRFFPEYRLIEVTYGNLGMWYSEICSIIQDGEMICLQGGGNLGNRYPGEERIRRRIIADFPDNPIIIFPQTVFFDKNAEGEQELALSVDIYGKHKRLTIFTRGERSMEAVQRYFPLAKCACIPDLALMLEKDWGLERRGLLLCIRDLKDESGLSEGEYAQVLDTVQEIDPCAEITNNLYQGIFESRIFRNIRRDVVRRELRKFAAHQVVVTDRLHGLIFAMATHTPCVAISSYNYKISEFQRKFADTESVFYLDKDLTQLRTSIQKAIEIGRPMHPVVDQSVFEDAFRMMAEG